MRRKLTKKEVITRFSEMWREVVASNPDARGDRIMKAEEFNNFVDMLNKDGQVSDSQAHNWTNPY